MRFLVEKELPLAPAQGVFNSVVLGSVVWIILVGVAAWLEVLPIY